jgi:pilus assembly protein CpaC
MSKEYRILTARRLLPVFAQGHAGLRRFLVLLLALVTLGFAAPALAQTVNYDLSTTSVMRINLPISKAVTVVISAPVGKVMPADPTIADAQPITDRSIYLVGKNFGTTTVNLFTAEGKPVGLLAVEVSADTSDIASSIRAAVPSAKVTISTVNGRIRLGGTVPDLETMDKVLAVVAQYGSPQIINTMTMVGGQQVNLEVRILEAQRDAGRELGLEWSGTVGGTTVNVANTSEGSFSQFMTGLIGNGINLNATIHAMESKALVRTLAEPNLTTLSGVKASFLAGGEVPIRTADPNGNIALSYRQFGVLLGFTPMVLDNDRIQIHLQPEVSGLNGFTGAGDPIFNTRNLDATVELRDGQSFSVAGLLQTDNKLNQDQLPWIGDVPILGSLFKSTSYKKHDTELVVIVTPRLVQPLTPGQVPATPLDQTRPANDVELFALGQMEVTPKMIKNFQTGEGVIGPYGYIIDLGDGK